MKRQLYWWTNLLCQCQHYIHTAPKKWTWWFSFRFTVSWEKEVNGIKWHFRTQPEFLSLSQREFVLFSIHLMQGAPQHITLHITQLIITIMHIIQKTNTNNSHIFQVTKLMVEMIMLNWIEPACTACYTALYCQKSNRFRLAFFVVIFIVIGEGHVFVPFWGSPHHRLLHSYHNARSSPLSSIPLECLSDKLFWIPTLLF